MTDTINNKTDPTILYYGFRVQLMVFFGLTNGFRKKIMDFLRFAFIFDTFFSPMT